MWTARKSVTMIAPERALPGRETPMAVPERHFVLGTPLTPPFPAGFETAVFGLGCFWGAERRFWQLPGIFTTAVGYAGGYTPHPTYEEVCSGATGHAEVVLVVFDAARTGWRDLLTVFWESHDPTQGMRQGNDIGTQYRSCVVARTGEQRTVAEEVRDRYDKALGRAGFDRITTVITDAITGAAPFYYAEAYHQQYLAKNPGGYCGLGGTGVGCGTP